MARRLSIKSNQDYQTLKQALHHLQDTNRIRRVRGGRFGHHEIPQTVVGTFEVTRQGYGFVTVRETGEEVFIPPRFRGMAVHGDRVEVSLFAEGARRGVRPGGSGRADGEKREGEIVRVIERGRSDVVGTLERSRNLYLVVPDDARIARDIFVARENLNKAREGEKVVVKIESWGVGHLNPEGRIVEVLGRAGEVSAEMLAVLREFRIPTSFPPEVLRQADRIAAVIPEAQISRRLDLRKTLCVTIDPEDAKDFDDAVSLEELPDGNFRLGVHIADVSHYVNEGSELDREALKRGTSVYLPNLVVPMLPERLSNIICSLRPGEDRLTYSVMMTITPRGTVREYDITESVIRSARRFAYEEVEQILEEGGEGPVARAERPEVVRMLVAMHALSSALTKKRMKEGSIDFEAPEAKFRFDDEGKPEEIIKKVRLRSHRLVEEFMLLANQTVARHIGVAKKKEEQRRPFLYRVHDLPDPDRIRELASFVEQFGYKLHVDSGVHSKDLQKLLERVRGTDEENVINEVAIRSMAKAEYSDQNIGHFGLGFPHYAHFTSPIRRYPDLVVHRLLKEYGGEVRGERREELARQLPLIARQTSAMERVAMEAERAAVKVMQVEYMKRHLGDEFHGIISGVVRYGLFIEIKDLLVEGMVHVRDMEDDYYVYDEKKYALIGRGRGRRYRLGDHVKVKVIRVNPEEREIDFILVGKEEKEARGRMEEKRRGRH